MPDDARRLRGGRSESWLSQVERGKRGIDSHSVLVRLAEVLRVDIEELTGSADRNETGRPAHPAAPLIEQAMMGYSTPGPLDSGEPGRQPSLDFLRAQARSAYQAYRATRYDAAGRILPALIRAVETTARIAGANGPAACAVRARVYDTTAALLSRVGEPFLAWAAADRAMFAAEQSSEQLGSSLSGSVQAGPTSLIGLPWPPRHGIGLQPKLQPCHLGWTRHLIPSGDRKPLVMCGHGLDGEAPLRRM